MAPTLTLGKKVAVALSAMLGLALLLSGCLITVNAELGKLLETAVHGTVGKLDQVAALQSGIQDLIMTAKRTQISYVIASLETGSKGQTCSACHAIGAVGGEEQEFAAAAAKVNETLRDLDPRLTARLRTGLADCEGLYRQYLLHARRKEFQQAHDILTEKRLPAVETLHQSADALAVGQRAVLEQSAKVADGLRLMSSPSRNLAFKREQGDGFDIMIP